MKNRFTTPIFADTSAFLALIGAKDKFHQAAVNFLLKKPEVITSSWVIEEFIAHLHARYGTTEARKVVDFIRNFVGLKVEFLDSDLLEASLQTFQQYASAKISLADVSSIVLMKNLDVNTIFAFDQRFRTVFNVNLVPN